MSGDPEQEYFTDGVSEELLNVLAKLPGLLVVARTSSFQFRGEDRDIIDIGQQLNVGLVLEGSIRKAGGQVRITAQLIDARSGFHLWSETYDRELENIFALQDEVSAAIVDALKKNLGLEVEAVPQVIAAASSEAHDAYLRGRYLIVQRTPTTIEGAIREYEKAISLDPDYALAHAELSIAIVSLPNYTGQNLTEAIARAVPHAERAMELDPGLAEAHAATGLLLERQGNMEDALIHLRRAIQINPNYVNPRLGIASSLDQLGRYAESFVEVETAVRLDPLSIPARGLVHKWTDLQEPAGRGRAGNGKACLHRPGLLRDVSRPSGLPRRKMGQWDAGPPGFLANRSDTGVRPQGVVLVFRHRRP